jgi:amidase
VLPRIVGDELDELTREWGFTIDEAEVAEYLDLTEYLLGVIDDVAERPSPPADNIPATRDPGRRPEPGEDPLNAVVRWCRVASEGEGILAGRRVAIKDSVAIAGIPMTCGSRVLEGYVPERDAAVTERVLAAGGEIVAVTNMDDLAFSGGGDTSRYGPTLCPFDLERTSGGSSSGSAAVLWYEGVEAAVGGDQGGSIRVPAAWCGVVGMKPTHSLVPYTGIVGIDQTFDHAGPLARTVEDAALLLQAIAGKHDSDPRQREVRSADYVGAVAAAPDDLRRVTIGLVAEGFRDDGTDEEVAVTAAVREAVELLRELGADVREVSLPEHVEAGGIAFAGYVQGMTELVTGGGNGFHWEGRYAPDLAVALRRGLAAHGDELPPQVKLVLAVGTHLRRRYLGAIYARAQNLRPWLRAAHDRALAEVDALLMPTTPGLPHAYDQMSLAARVKRGWAVLANTYPTDFTGHPALTLPLAETNGLPVGVMLVGRRFEDDRLLALARTVERAIGWRPDPSHVQARAVVASTSSSG